MQHRLHGCPDKETLTQKQPTALFSSRVSSNNSLRSPTRTTMVIQDDSLPAAPPPQIRILKRPVSNGSLGSPLSQNRPTPQIKSLAQREAEYAEARKRILGSACAEESPPDKPTNDRCSIRKIAALRRFWCLSPTPLFSASMGKLHANTQWGQQVELEQSCRPLSKIWSSDQNNGTSDFLRFL